MFRISAAYTKIELITLFWGGFRGLCEYSLRLLAVLYKSSLLFSAIWHRYFFTCWPHLASMHKYFAVQHFFLIFFFSVFGYTVVTSIKVRSLSGCARLLSPGSMSNGFVQVSTQFNSNQINDDTMSADQHRISVVQSELVGM